MAGSGRAIDRSMLAETQFSYGDAERLSSRRRNGMVERIERRMN
jgi:hypothetical protein